LIVRFIKSRQGVIGPFEELVSVNAGAWHVVSRTGEEYDAARNIACETS
jgi:hypothetical protein